MCQSFTDHQVAVHHQLDLEGVEVAESYTRVGVVTGHWPSSSAKKYVKRPVGFAVTLCAMFAVAVPAYADSPQ